MSKKTDKIIDRLHKMSDMFFMFNYSVAAEQVMFLANELEEEIKLIEIGAFDGKLPEPDEQKEADEKDDFPF